MSCLRMPVLRLLARSSIPARVPSRILPSRVAKSPLGFGIHKRSLHQTWSRLSDGLDDAVRSTSDDAGHAGKPEAERRRFSSGPSEHQLFIAQLPYSTTEESVVAAFKQFGEVTKVHLMKTQAGMSRGAMFVTYTEAEAIERAIKEMDQQEFEGRRIHVSKAISKPRAPTTGWKQPIPTEPTNSLYIGNMSYNLSDRDLNEIFGQIKNCVDVRVAIDRRTGQPRGFAHADFTDIDSAREAKTYLDKQVIHGRMFRTSYAVPKRIPDRRRSDSIGSEREANAEADGEQLDTSRDARETERSG